MGERKKRRAKNSARPLSGRTRVFTTGDQIRLLSVRPPGACVLASPPPFPIPRVYQVSEYCLITRYITIFTHSTYTCTPGDLDQRAVTRASIQARRVTSIAAFGPPPSLKNRYVTLISALEAKRTSSVTDD
jgi:hypothetical protein